MILELYEMGVFVRLIRLVVVFIMNFILEGDWFCFVCIMIYCFWSDGMEWEGGEVLGFGNNFIVSVVLLIYILMFVMVLGEVMDLKWNI